MRVNSQTGYYSSFLVRIWVEDGKIVRGRIQHVGTRQSVYFSDLDKMVEFVMAHCHAFPNNGVESADGGKSGFAKSQLSLELGGD
jgi:hypothetical protein